MKKQIVALTAANGSKLKDQPMLTHSGLGMHTECRGMYSITYVASGCKLFDVELGYTQTKELIKGIAELFDWTQSKEIIVQNKEKVVEAKKYYWIMKNIG
jgi:hypothetical protein